MLDHLVAGIVDEVGVGARAHPHGVGARAAIEHVAAGIAGIMLSKLCRCRSRSAAPVRISDSTLSGA